MAQHEQQRPVGGLGCVPVAAKQSGAGKHRRKNGGNEKIICRVVFLKIRISGGDLVKGWAAGHRRPEGQCVGLSADLCGGV